LPPKTPSPRPAAPPAGSGFDEATLHTPIGELVAGLDEVAHLAIPYARMPRRAHSAYSAEFIYWSDIAAQTPHSLLNHPKAGEVTVRAVLAAAADALDRYRTGPAAPDPVGAAAAVARLVDQLGERDRIMLSARVWTVAQPQSMRSVAARLGVHATSVKRSQPRAEARFAELLTDPVHREVSQYAAALGQRLGPLILTAGADAQLARLGVDPSSLAAQVLLHLAGPYALHDGWLENTATAGHQQVSDAIEALLQLQPAPSTESLVQTLTAVGMPRDAAASYLGSQVGLRRFGDVWVRWGDSTAEQAEAVLHVRGAPATAEDIFAGIDTAGTTLRALRDRLFGDPRFVRASRRTFGLRTWGIDEYRGIFAEIAARIDAAGGRLAIDELVADMAARFPDVAEASVRSYLSAQAFITEKSIMRRRTDADPSPTVPPLNTVPGAFTNGDNQIRLAVAVTSDVARGSGLVIRHAVGAALGVSPGQHRVFTSPHGPVVVTWRLSATNGPTIGSLRTAALAAGADLGDTLVLVFGLNDASLDFLRIGADVAGLPRLARLLGRTVRSPAAALATSLACPRAEVATVLRKRGDHQLAALLDSDA
jgi:hypothetical protein